MNMKAFNTGNKVLRLVEYGDELMSQFQNPEIDIESQDYGGCESFEIDSKEQLQQIIEHLQALRESWKQ